MQKQSEPELIWGAAGIAKEIRKNERETFYLLKTGRLPVVRVGRQYVGRRHELRDPTTWPKGSK